jgi:hypothetical protein
MPFLIECFTICCPAVASQPPACPYPPSSPQDTFPGPLYSCEAHFAQVEVETPNTLYVCVKSEHTCCALDLALHQHAPALHPLPPHPAQDTFPYSTKALQPFLLGKVDISTLPVRAWTLAYSSEFEF